MTENEDKIVNDPKYCHLVDIAITRAQADETITLMDQSPDTKLTEIVKTKPTTIGELDGK